MIEPSIGVAGTMDMMAVRREQNGTEDRFSDLSFFRYVARSIGSTADPAPIEASRDGKVSASTSASAIA